MNDEIINEICKENQINGDYEIDTDFTIKDFLKLGLQKQAKQIRDEINEANIKASDSWFNERCENCRKDIMASIHHFVDSFYKDIIYRLEKYSKISKEEK